MRRVRILVLVLSGILLGIVIHIAVILALPAMASDTVWSRIAALAPENKTVVLPAIPPGQANPLRLDPLLSYAICRVNLAAGPAVVSATLPDAYWSLAIFNPSGTIVYSTTNRDGIGKNLNLGIFNADQTHLLAEQQIDVADGLLIVEADDNDVFVVVRLAPQYQAVRQRYEAALSKIVCGNIDIK
jgi:uncharacterized membrane protein